MNNPTIQPFLKWAGGKRQLLPHIDTHLPPNFPESIDTYIEPFLGGGAVFFHLTRHHKFSHTIISDMNPQLTNLYLTIRDDKDTLSTILEELQTCYNTSDDDGKKTLFHTYRDQYNTHILSNQRTTHTAALFLFLNKTCFNGLYRTNSESKFNSPFGYYKKPAIYNPATLHLTSEALQGVIILTGDYTASTPYINAKTFLYLDPPYRPLTATANFNTYTKTAFNDAEQERLADWCDEVNSKGAKFLLSNSDPKNVNPHDNFFDDLYQKYDITRVHARRAINSNGAKRAGVAELLVKNY